MIIKNFNLEKLKKPLGVLQSLLTIVMFTLLPLIAFTLISSKTDLLNTFRSFVVLTGSMSPLIPTGSIVYTAKTDLYKNGDIISFEKGSVTVTHRIIDVVDKDGKHISYLANPMGGSKSSEIFYKTRGDANNVVDSELVPAKSVVGQAMFHLPFLGFLVMFLKSIQGFLIAVILPTFVFILFELWKIKGEIEKNIERKMLQKMGRV